MKHFITRMAKHLSESQNNGGSSQQAAWCFAFTYGACASTVVHGSSARSSSVGVPFSSLWCTAFCKERSVFIELFGCFFAHPPHQVRLAAALFRVSLPVPDDGNEQRQGDGLPRSRPAEGEATSEVATVAGVVNAEALAGWCPGICIHAFSV